jgi:modulator of FtsH protease HflC
MRRVLAALLVLAAVAVGLLWAGEAGWGPLVITHEGEEKLVLFFGNPASIQTEPGVSFRLPLVTDVLDFDGRLIYLNAEAMSIRTRDEDNIIVDNYVIWHIVDPLQFYASFPTGMRGAEERIDKVVEDELRGVIGQKSLQEVVAEQRVPIMDAVSQASDEKLREYGIGVEAVRINRTELPPSTEQNVFARMRAERGRLARKYRAEGEEKGRTIRAEADREARVTEAEAHREAEIQKGEGDAEATRIYSEAHSIAPDFYAFQRRLEAYRKTIGDQTTLVLPPENNFFSLFGREGATGPAPGVR